jgi:hypothetical protein
MLEIEKVYEITLDIKKEVERPYIEFTQGDTLNKIVITILNDDKPITLSDYTYKIILQRPDSILVQNIPNVIDNKLIYDIGTTEISSSGLVQASLEIFSGLERMTVKTFTFVAVATLDNGIKIDSITQCPDMDKNYVHTQIIPSSEWLINHNLKKYCSVTVVDSADNVVIGDIAYIDQDNIKISFSIQLTGKAYLN